MRNNNGFTLIETLAMLVVITLVSIFIIRNISETMSISKKEAYGIMKDNIISSSYDYLKECNNNIISCNLEWDNGKTSFDASRLESSGYFKNLHSPIDNKYLGNCLKINVKKEEANFDVSLEDNCY
jgi:competence protein ComGC